MNILIVDDDPVNLIFLEAALKSQGHKVTMAEDGEKAWLAMLLGGFQFVICDWSLPGISGTELCKKVRERNGYGYVYFILITGHEGTDKLNMAMDAGVDDFLTKPLDMNALTVRLRVANRILDFHRQVGALKELVPICMYCKKIRNDKNYWENVEIFFSAHTGADFTHSLCPDCYTEKIKPEIDSVGKGDPNG